MAHHHTAETSLIERKHVVEHRVRRESQLTFAGDGVHRSISKLYGYVLHPVLRECGVGIPTEPINRHPRCRKLNTHAITLVEIARNGLVELYFARRNELVFIVHVVEIKPSREVLRGKFVAHFKVV